MKITVELDAYEFATVVDILVNKNFEDYTYNDTDDKPEEKPNTTYAPNDNNLKFLSILAKALADKIAKSSSAD